MQTRDFESFLISRTEVKEVKKGQTEKEEKTSLHVHYFLSCHLQNNGKIILL